VGVVIPAQNEESSIERCLRNVLRSCEASDRCGKLWIVVVADRCTDQTLELARREIGSRGEAIESCAGSPGSARRLGAAAVMHHFRAEDPRLIWLANTDADSRVPSDWISTHLQHADGDAVAVAGIVELDSEELLPEVDALFKATYKVGADGTHTHVHGANFGVRADAYLDVGGWSDATVSEDHCLWGRLRRRGWRLNSSAGSVVQTSARLRGRASGGFADTLRLRLYAGDRA
jgi:cellulose synthase/poly-beta-1,6-N-acetylglucosamine synthase-like glycosyltransferase